ncbi:protein-tyrosine phosphatase family protein [Sinorhizobium sp. BG8]|uniref:phosphatase domain-containing putative toxin n=1 Tax=Sinorhizobium sp. BG8 TaxID=2613773 RepID=UPI00193EB9AB|nr:protein-tyrosine phosphatase family protein [Sinorhizobium sp. BG8]QRM54920.1 protein phosphatase [Sinorhizobium sp. BG8]
MEPVEPFTIATVPLASGGRIGISRIPGRSGAYDADLRTIRDWGADVVVSMTDTFEMEARGCSDLGLRLASMGIGWFHLPVRDLGGPSGSNASSWPTISDSLHALLDRGGAVLVHCHGGHGRSGMVALRLLVERGEEPQAALRRIRLVRPGAVQSEAQFLWAASATG